MRYRRRSRGRANTLRPMPAVADVPDDAIVIRFSPIQAESVFKKLGRAKVVEGHYGLSCFVGVPEKDEERTVTIARLVQAAGFSGIDLGKLRKIYVCSTAKQVVDLGYVFMKDDYPAEVDEHYCVDLGEAPTLDDVTKFLSVFEPEKVPEVQS